MGNKTNDRDMNKKHQFIKKLYYIVVRHHLVHNRYNIYVPYSCYDSFKLGDLSEKSVFLFFLYQTLPLEAEGVLSCPRVILPLEDLGRVSSSVSFFVALYNCTPESRPLF